MQMRLRWLVKVRECESEFLVRESDIFSLSGCVFFFYSLNPCPPRASDSDLK